LGSDSGFIWGVYSGYPRGLAQRTTTVLLLNCQALPALGPATIDHGLSGLGLHSMSETVGTMTLHVTRLKSSFAHGLSLIIYPKILLATVRKKSGNYLGRYLFCRGEKKIQ
jgi:hypothetical protein